MAAVPTIGRADRVAAVRPASADEHAGLLYEQLYDRVFGYCLYRLGSREEAEDAAQVTFVHALRGLRRGIVPRVEAAWVFAIAKNVCLERHQVRGRRRAREVLLDPADLDVAAVEDEWDGEDTARLRDALTRLSDAQREAVLLREWRGLSYREIAEEMSLSVSAVETLIFRARRSLAEHLTEETGRSRAVSGLLLGPLAAGLKVVGGLAAKVAVAAALAAAALTGGVLGGDGAAEQPRRPVVVEPTVASPAVEPVFLRPSAALGVRTQSAPKPDDPGRAKSSGKKNVTTPAGSDPKPDPDPPLVVAPPPAKNVVDGVVGGVVDPVLEPVVEPVAPVVDDVEGTLEPVLDLVPELPQVGLP